jgi:hypothetical protein
MKKTITIISCLLLAGCELVFEVDVPFEGQQLTVNAPFTPDSVWKATVSLNRFILNEPPFERIENAEVAVYQDGVFIDNLIHQRDGIYKSQHTKPLPGNNYEIRVSAANYPPVIGKSNLPPAAPITNVTILNSKEDINGVEQSTIRLTFQDDPEATNYYQVVVLKRYEEVRPRIGFVVRTYTLQITSDDPLVQNENPVESDGLLLKDNLFNGKEAEISFKVPAGLYFYDYNIICLRTVSEDYYKYMTTSQLQNRTATDPFSQPVHVHTTLENGFGIFAGYNQSTFEYGFPQPVITSITSMQGVPMKASVGDIVIINGSNLENCFVHFTSATGTIQADVSLGIISYNDVVTYGLKNTDNKKIVRVPPNSVTGKIYVWNLKRVAVSETDFEIIN